MESARRPALSNAHVGLMIFLVAEVMLFAALISAYLIFRAGERSWPPGDLPRLPLGLTSLNTAGLLASGAAMALALRGIRRNARSAFLSWLGLTQFLGLIFLAVQGTEWARLVGPRVTVRAGMYGGIFYALVGLHAFHVLGAFLWLCEIARRARLGRYSAAVHLGPALCAIYWFFVVALWVLLFLLVYLPWGS